MARRAGIARRVGLAVNSCAVQVAALPTASTPRRRSTFASSTIPTMKNRINDTIATRKLPVICSPRPKNNGPSQLVPLSLIS